MATHPEQLRKQVEAAQALVDAQYGKKPADGAVTDVNPKPAGEAVAPVKAQGSAPVEDENSQTYAQRWRSLQGVYNSAQQRVGTLEQQVQQLQQLVSTLQTAPAMSVNPKGQFLTDQDTADYGNDLIDMARRAAREELKDFAGAVGSLKHDVDSMRPIVPVVQRLTQENQQSASERFFAALARIVPDYEQVNSNPQFHQWLLTPDPMTGIMRQTYLVDAQRSGDVDRVATIFNAWKSLSGTQGQTNTRTNVQRELELQQAPGRNLSAPVSEKTGRIWDPREITALYDEKRRGGYAGREAEFKALEQDIFKAQQEGRIVRKAA